MTGRFGNRCNCYGGHNSSSGRCHDIPDHNHAYCEDCIRECGKFDLHAPDFAVAALMSTFDGKTAEVIAVKYGEKGYYPTTWGRQTREWIEEENSRIGIAPVVAAAMSTCSVFGNWGNYEDVLKHLQEALNKKVEV